jgi:hypothetical protein
MKYVLVGSIDTAWVGRHAERTKLAKAKLQDLGVTLDAVYYTQGPYDFVDVIDSPDPEAALAFSVWYANQGWAHPNPTGLRSRRNGARHAEGIAWTAEQRDGAR